MPYRARQQCQNCFKNEDPPAFKLKSCQQCSRARYCNRDCQRSDWPSHKKVCKMAAKASELIEASTAKAALDSTGQILDLKPLESKLKQWIPVYRPLLAYAVINALTLQTTPDRCMTEMLHITLKQTSNKDIPRYFAVEGLSLRSTAEAGLNPGVDINFILEKSQQIRAEGGVGVALVMLHIVEFRFAHLTPTVLRGSLKNRPIDGQWASAFTEMVAAGKALDERLATVLL